MVVERRRKRKGRAAGPGGDDTWWSVIHDQGEEGAAEEGEDSTWNDADYLNQVLSPGYTPEDSARREAVQSLKAQGPIELKLRNPVRPEPVEWAVGTRPGRVARIMSGWVREARKALASLREACPAIKLTDSAIEHKGRFMFRIDIGKRPACMSGEAEESELRAVIRRGEQLASRMERVADPTLPLEAAAPLDWRSEAGEITASSHLWRMVLEDFAKSVKATAKGQRYTPKYDEGKLVWRLWDGAFLSHEGAAALCVLNGVAVPLTDAMVSEWLEMAFVRHKVYCSILLARGDTSIIPSLPFVKKLFIGGDLALIRRGNSAYSLLKLLEPLAIRAILMNEERIGAGLSKAFCDAMIGEALEEGGTTDGAEFMEAVLELSKLPPSAAGQAFGCFRVWGYPEVRVLRGVEKVKKVAQADKHVDPLMALIARGETCKALYKMVRGKEGSWPESKKLPETGELRCALEEGREIHENAQDYHETDWALVHPMPQADPRELVSDLDLVSDKACSVDKDRLVEYLSRYPGKLPPVQERRLLQRIMEEECAPIADLLLEISRSGLAGKYLVIGVTPKERELKIDPRLFSLLTVKFRMYCAATEQIISRAILPALADVTMTRGESTLHSIMDRLASGMADSTEELTLVYNLDFVKWNLQMRDELVHPTFSLIDEWIGMPNLVSRTHEFFRRSTFYIADGVYVPTAEAVEAGEGDYVWKDHKGGMEGLRQKGWTVVTSALLRALAREMGAKADIMGAGDNQVLVLTFQYPHTSKGSGPSDAARKVVEGKAEEFLKQLDVYMDRAGLPVKAEETWVSPLLFAYGKKLYYAGVPIGLGHKKCMRICWFSTEDDISLTDSIGAIMAACSSAAEQFPDFRIPVALAYSEVYRTMMDGLSWFPSAPAGLWVHAQESLKEIAPLRVDELASAVGPLLEDKLALAELAIIGGRSFGGLGTVNVQGLLAKGQPDPPAADLASMRGYSRLADCPPLVSDSLMRMLSPVYRSTVDTEELHLDPTSLNLDRPPTAIGVSRELAREYLESRKVRNETIRELVRAAESARGSLLDIMDQTDPLYPRYTCSVLENSYYGIVDGMMSRLSMPQTTQRLAREISTDKAKGALHKLLQADAAAFAHMLRCSSLNTIYPGLRRTTFSPFHYLEMLRKESWDLPNLAGVTSPSPVGALLLRRVADGECVGCKHDLPYFHVQVTEPEYDGQGTLKRGPFGLYVGGETRSKQSAQSKYEPVSRAPALSAVRDLLAPTGWVYGRGSEWEAVVHQLVGQLTDVPIDMFISSAIDVVSAVSHRLEDPRTDHHSGPALAVMYGSYVRISTNTMGIFARGLNNRPLHYQLFLCAIHSIMSVRLSRGLPAGVYHAHIHSVENYPELEDPPVSFLPGAQVDRALHRLSLDRAPPSIFRPSDKVRFRLRSIARDGIPLSPSQLSNPERRDLLASICASVMLSDLVARLSSEHWVETSEMLTATWMFEVDLKPCLRKFFVGLCALALSHWSVGRLQGSVGEAALPPVRSLVGQSDARAWESLATFLSVRETLEEAVALVPDTISPQSFPATRAELCVAAKSMVLAMAAHSAEWLVSEGRFPFEVDLWDTTWRQHRAACQPVYYYVRAQHLSPDWGVVQIARRSIREAGAIRDENLIGTQLERSERWAERLQANAENVSRREVSRVLESCSMVWVVSGHFSTIVKLLCDTTGVRRDRYRASPLRMAVPQIPVGAISPCPPGRLESGVRLELPGMSVRRRQGVELQHILSRPLDLGTTAPSKWATVIGDVDWSSCTGVAAVADGSGGVGALCAMIAPLELLYYNSMVRDQRGSGQSHPDYYPAAYMVARVDPQIVAGVDDSIATGGDITGRETQRRLIKVCAGRIGLLTCDADVRFGDDWASAVEVTQALVRIAVATQVPVVIQKAFIHYPSVLTLQAGLFSEVFERVEVVRSVLTQTSSDEVFIRASRPRPAQNLLRVDLSGGWMQARASLAWYDLMSAVAFLSPPRDLSDRRRQVRDALLSVLPSELADRSGFRVLMWTVEVGAWKAARSRLHAKSLLRHMVIGLGSVYNYAQITSMATRHRRKAFSSAVAKKVSEMMILLSAAVICRSDSPLSLLSRPGQRFGLILFSSGRQWIAVPSVKAGTLASAHALAVTSHSVGAFSLPSSHFSSSDPRLAVKLLRDLGIMQPGWWERSVRPGYSLSDAADSAYTATMGGVLQCIVPSQSLTEEGRGLFRQAARDWESFCASVASEVSQGWSASSGVGAAETGSSV